jgi:hypothetical protein
MMRIKTRDQFFVQGEVCVRYVWSGVFNGRFDVPMWMTSWMLGQAVPLALYASPCLTRDFATQGHSCCCARSIHLLPLGTVGEASVNPLSIHPLTFRKRGCIHNSLFTTRQWTPPSLSHPRPYHQALAAHGAVNTHTSTSRLSRKARQHVLSA